MNCVKVNPNYEMRGLVKNLNRFMGGYQRDFEFQNNCFKPKADIIRSKDETKIILDLPGISKDDVTISVNKDRMLTIKGEKKSTQLDDNMKMHRQERCYGNFSRSFILPEYIDLDKVNATFENGVLEIDLVRSEAYKPFEVQIQ